MNMNVARVLVACVGNIFLGDDAFGVEVARRLAGVDLPEGVRDVDFGIRGLDLTYALLDGYEAVILVDAAPRGGPPGTLYVIEPDQSALSEIQGAGLMEAHGMDPVKVLRLVASMGGKVDRLLVVGCEPQTCLNETDDFQDGMSAPVRAAVDEAVALIVSLAARLLRGEEIAPRGVPYSNPNPIPIEPEMKKTEVQPCRD